MTKITDAELMARADQLWLEQQKRKMLSPGMYQSAGHALQKLGEAALVTYLLACTVIGLYVSISWLTDAIR